MLPGYIEIGDTKCLLTGPMEGGSDATYQDHTPGFWVTYFMCEQRQELRFEIPLAVVLECRVADGYLLAALSTTSTQKAFFASAIDGLDSLTRELIYSGDVLVSQEMMRATASTHDRSKIYLERMRGDRDVDRWSALGFSVPRCIADDDPLLRESDIGVHSLRKEVNAALPRILPKLLARFPLREGIRAD